MLRGVKLVNACLSYGRDQSKFHLGLPPVVVLASLAVIEEAQKIAAGIPQDSSSRFLLSESFRDHSRGLFTARTRRSSVCKSMREGVLRDPYEHRTKMVILQVERVKHGRVWRVNPQVVERILPYDMIGRAVRNLGLDLTQELALPRRLLVRTWNRQKAKRARATRERKGMWSGQQFLGYCCRKCIQTGKIRRPAS